MSTAKMKTTPPTPGSNGSPSRPSKGPLHLLVTLSLFFTAFSSSRAADRSWVGATSDWDVPANWAPSLTPTTFDTVYIYNGGTALVPNGVAGIYSAMRVGSVSGSSGSINISGGSLQGSSSEIGYNINSIGSTTITSGTWLAGNLSIGVFGTGSVNINGGVVTSAQLHIGSGSGGNGTLAVSSGTYQYSDLIMGLAPEGHGSLLINSGGLVAGNSATIGYSSSNHVVTVSGFGSSWESDGIVVGQNGSNNNIVTIADGGLVKVGDTPGETVQFSLNGGTNNVVRLDGGYLALYGDQTA